MTQGWGMGIREWKWEESNGRGGKWGTGTREGKWEGKESLG